MQFKLLDIVKDLRQMTRRELLKLFGSKRSRRIKITPLIRNIVWQAYKKIQSGEEKPVRGNLRTFWYRFVKPVLSHISDDDRMKTDPYDIMTAVFSGMVFAGLFSYRDFDFTDERWENRVIGTTHPSIILYSEKTGSLRFLKQMHEKHGVTVIALGGAPSALTSEYTADEIKQALGDDTRSVHMIGIVDYDPSGYQIASSFQNHLESYGLEVLSNQLLIHPRHYTDEELELFGFAPPRKQETKNEKWLAETNGINGCLQCLEVESMDWDRLEVLVDEAVIAVKQP